jgi:hypothetical protein
LAAVPSLDQQIDDLYKQPLDQFTRARNELAKSLKGDDAKRVRALAKPTVVPWAVNQLYWRARGTYDRLLKAGERLRNAQIAALEGKSADVRTATDAHRHAIADAVAEAERLAAPSGSKPSPDVLTRTLEALSLAAEPPERPGRLTEGLRPAGFEALDGIAPVVSRKSQVVSQKSHVTDQKSEAARRREDALARQAARDYEAALRRADAAVARAEAGEKLARAAWERAHDALLEARRTRDAVKSSI